MKKWLIGLAVIWLILTVAVFFGLRSMDDRVYESRSFWLIDATTFWSIEAMVTLLVLSWVAVQALLYLNMREQMYVLSQQQLNDSPSS